jgi:hypothetical protein
MTRLAVFLDTMIYLHFPPVDQLDWIATLEAMRRDSKEGSPEILIVCPRITVRELDKHKDRHKDRHKERTIRERAGRVLRQLDQWSEAAREANSPVRLRDGVWMTVDYRTPIIDYAAYGLERDVQDDQLIAAMLQHRREHPDDEAWLVSQDQGPRGTARSHRFGAFSLDDDLMLPEEPDPVVKENRDLRQRLLTVEKALPKLTLSFRKPRQRHAAKISEDQATLWLLVPPALSPLGEYIESAIKVAERKCLPSEFYGEPPSKNAKGIYAAFWEPSQPADIERYERERTQYLEQMRTFLEREWRDQEKKRRSFALGFVLSNDGGAPAQGVHIQVECPSHVRGAGVTASLPEDKRPKAPRRPMPLRPATLSPTEKA